MENILEQWKPVLGYEGLYEVSDQGRVRSVDRWLNCRDGQRQWHRGKLLKQLDNGNGYQGVALSNTCKGTKPKRFYVHFLVLDTFVGPRPDKHQAAHGDGDRSNNRLSNLRWATVSENIADKLKHGTHQLGERNPVAVLNEANVISIRQNYCHGLGSTLAQQYGVDPGTIYAVVKRKNWAWLP
jgi:hypothetical protein